MSTFSIPRYGFTPFAGLDGMPGMIPNYGAAMTSPITDPGELMPTGGGAVSIPTVNIPTISAAGGGGFLGLNTDQLKLGLSGLQTIGNLWAAYEANKLAKQQFRFTKGVTETNLANQIKSYNTSLEDRARSRAFVEGQSAAQAQDYIDKNKLTRAGGF